MRTAAKRFRYLRSAMAARRALHELADAAAGAATPLGLELAAVMLGLAELSCDHAAELQNDLVDDDLEAVGA